MMLSVNSKHLTIWQRHNGTTTKRRIKYIQTSVTSINTTLQVAQAMTSHIVNYKMQSTFTEEFPVKPFYSKGLRRFFINIINKSGQKSSHSQCIARLQDMDILWHAIRKIWYCSEGSVNTKKNSKIDAFTQICRFLAHKKINGKYFKQLETLLKLERIMRLVCLGSIFSFMEE